MKQKILLIFAGLVLFVVVSPAAASAQLTRLHVAPRPGVWKVNATDVEKVKWSGTLNIAKRGIRSGSVHYRGHFYWISADKATAGREYFSGSFDRKKGKLRLKAYAVKNIRGELGIGNYVVSVDRKGTKMFRGRWSGAESVPGSWTAIWVKFR